jgi:hypothetical protein
LQRQYLRKKGGAKLLFLFLFDFYLVFIFILAPPFSEGTGVAKGGLFILC